MIFWKKIPRRRLVFLAALVPLAVDVGWWQIGPIMTDKLEITMLDVGQGESTLVRFPGGQTWLVDGGGKHGSAFDVGKNVVVPALLRKGIHKVDRLVLTHPHHDHFKGLAAVAEYFGPDVLWTNGFGPIEEEQGEWNEFEDRLQAAGVVSTTVDRSDIQLEIGGVKVDVLYPDRALPEDIELNDTSLVIRLTYNDVSILLTGDLEKRGESMLLSNGDDVSATILKLGHHGSDTSSGVDFIKAVKPKIALISVGQLNEYGMPDEIVLDRLKEAGAQIYRTDLHGAVTVTTNGHEVDVRTVITPSEAVR
jgi:competence protein ComEC